MWQSCNGFGHSFGNQLGAWFDDTVDLADCRYLYALFLIGRFDIRFICPVVFCIFIWNPTDGDCYCRNEWIIDF